MGKYNLELQVELFKNMSVLYAEDSELLRETKDFFNKISKSSYNAIKKYSSLIRFCYYFWFYKA